MIRSIAGNILPLILEKIFQILGSLYLIAIISEGLGVVKFGEWQLLLSYIAIFSALSILCASDLIIPRYTSKLSYPLTLNRIISTVLFIRVLTTLVGLIILCVILYSYESESSYKLSFLLLAITTVINEITSTFSAYLLSSKKSYYLSISRLLGFVAKVVIIGLLDYFQALTILNIVYVWLLECIFTNIIILFFFKKNIDYKYCRPKINHIYLILKRSLIFGLGLGAFIIYRKLDRIIFSNNFSVFELGIYSSSAQLTDVVYQVVIATASVLAPIILYDKKNYSKLLDNMKLIMVGYFIVSYTICYVLFVNSELLYGIIFTSEYLDGVKYLNVMIWSFPIIFLDTIFLLRLIGNVRYSFYLIKWLGTMAIYSFLAIGLISSLGVMSISYSFVICSVITFLFSSFSLIKNSKG